MLPDNFVKLDEKYGGRGSKWDVTFGLSGSNEVKLGFYYRGKPLFEADAIIFRRLMSQAQGTLFVDKGISSYSVQEKQLLEEMEYILDNAGENQVFNRCQGELPRFRLERLETVLIKNRPMLLMQGAYQSKNGIDNVIYCLMFERDKNHKDCNIEEVYLQARTKELFKKYFPDFEKSIESINL